MILKKRSMNKEIKMDRKSNSTWKTRICFSKIKFQFRIKSDPSDIEDTDNLSKHHNFYDDVSSFDKKIFQFL